MQPAYNDLRGSVWRGLPAHFSDCISSFSLTQLTHSAQATLAISVPGCLQIYCLLGVFALAVFSFSGVLFSQKLSSFPYLFFFNQIFRDAFPDCCTWNIFPSVTQSLTALLTFCLLLQRAECWCYCYLPCQNVIFTWTGTFSCSRLLLLHLKQPSAHSRNSISAC